MKQHFEIYRANGATIAGYVEDGHMMIVRRDRQSLPKSMVAKVIETINDDIGPFAMNGFIFDDPGDFIVHLKEEDWFIPVDCS